MMYYNPVTVILNDGYTIEDYRDAWYPEEAFDDVADALDNAVALHGSVTDVQIDGYDVPPCVVEKGLDKVCELAEWFDHTGEGDKGAVWEWVYHNASSPEPWDKFYEYYIGKFEDDEAFGRYIVSVDAEVNGINIPDWLDDLIQYADAYDPAKHWKRNGYYFWHK